MEDLGQAVGAARAEFLAGCDKLVLEFWPEMDLRGVAGRVPQNVLELIWQLSKTFPNEVLVQAGLAVPAGSGCLPAPHLVAGEPIAAVLVRKGAIGGLVCSGGLLGKTDATEFRRYVESLPGCDSDSAVGVWLAHSVADAAVLAKAGAACLPTWALAWEGGDLANTLGGKRVRVVCPLNALDSDAKEMQEAALTLVRRDAAGEIPFRLQFARIRPEDRREIEILAGRCEGTSAQIFQDERRHMTTCRGDHRGPAWNITAEGLAPMTSACLRAGSVARGKRAYREVHLLLESVEPAVEMPGFLRLATKFCCDSQRFDGWMELQAGGRVEIPREHFPGLLDVATDDLPAAILTALNGGIPPRRDEFPELPHEEVSGNKKAAKPPLRIPASLTEHSPIRRARAYLADADGRKLDPEPVDVLLVRPPAVSAPALVRAAADVVCNAASRQRFLWCEDITVVGGGGQGGAGGLGPREAREVLSPFVVEPTLEKLCRRAEELGEGLAAVVGLAGRQATTLAQLVAMVHLSPLQVETPGGRCPNYGPLQALVIGETGSHKTTGAVGITQWIGLAEVAASDTTTRAGLLYSVQSRQVAPGLLPRNHGGMLVVDEIHKIKAAEIRAATFARSQGELRVDAVARAVFPMQTRFLAIGNLRRHGVRDAHGHDSVSLSDLDAGIQGCGFLEPEEMRRFDVVAVMSRQAALTRDPAAGAVAGFDGEAFRALVSHCWDLSRAGQDRCAWGEGAYDALRRAARALRMDYETQVLPLLGPDAEDKLLRLAAASARLMPPIPDGQIHITPGHVEFAAAFLRSIYDAPDNGLRRVAAAFKRSQPRADELDGVWEDLQKEIPCLADIIEYLGGGSVSTYRLANRCGVGLRTMQAHVAKLRKADLVDSHGCKGIEATAYFRQAIARRRERVAAEGPGIEAGGEESVTTRPAGSVVEAGVDGHSEGAAAAGPRADAGLPESRNESRNESSTG